VAEGERLDADSVRVQAAVVIARAAGGAFAIAHVGHAARGVLANQGALADQAVGVEMPHEANTDRICAADQQGKAAWEAQLLAPPNLVLADSNQAVPGS
jgi:hypothetical protein